MRISADKKCWLGISNIQIRRMSLPFNSIKLIEPYQDVSCPGSVLRGSGYVCMPDYYDTCVMQSISYAIEEVPGTTFQSELL